MSGGPASAADKMDRLYGVQRHFYNVTRGPYLLGRETLLQGLCPPTGGRVLELGCGTARNLIRAAQLYPTARLYGLDVSSAMLATARRSIARHRLEGRVHVAQGCAATFEPSALFGGAPFDRVFISYALSMISDWHSVMARAVGALGDRGSLHVVDFGLCAGLPRLVRQALFAWLAHFSVAPRCDLEAASQRLAARHDLTLYFTELHRGYAGYVVLRRR